MQDAHPTAVIMPFEHTKIAVETKVLNISLLHTPTLQPTQSPARLHSPVSVLLVSPMICRFLHFFSFYPVQILTPKNPLNSIPSHP